MVTINLNADQVRALNEGKISGQEARNILREIKGQLTKQDGSIRSGVFKLTQHADGSATLSTTRTSAITRQSRLDAGSRAVSNLLGSAHGLIYESNKGDIESYLTLTHNKFGSKSFAKLEEAFLNADHSLRGNVLESESRGTSNAGPTQRKEGRVKTDGIEKVAQKISSRHELLSVRTTHPPKIVGGEASDIKTADPGEIRSGFSEVDAAEGFVVSSNFERVSENAEHLSGFEKTPYPGEVYVPQAATYVAPKSGPQGREAISQLVSQSFNESAEDFAKLKTARDQSQGDTSRPIRNSIIDAGRTSFEIGGNAPTNEAPTALENLVNVANAHGVTAELQIFLLGTGLTTGLNAEAPAVFSKAFLNDQRGIVSLRDPVPGAQQETRTIKPVDGQPGTFEITNTFKEVGKSVLIHRGETDDSVFNAPAGKQLEITHKTTLRVTFDLSDPTSKPRVEVTDLRSLWDIKRDYTDTTGAFRNTVTYKLETKQSPASAPNPAIENNLLPLLNESSKEFFRDLLTPPIHKQSPDGVQPTLVIGDGDGSAGRLILAGIQAGRIELQPEEYRLLASVLNKESSLFYSGAEDNQPFGKWKNDVLKVFQQDREVSRDLEQIAANAIYKPTSAETRKLVFIGDIVHDRFANNKKATATLIERLHDNGSVFILGNHDHFDEVAVDGKIKYADFGEFSHVQLTREESQALEERCFVHSYFDPESGNFFIHNGVERQENSPDGSTYTTAFGNISANSAAELSQKINQARPLKDDHEQQIRGFTSFRPKDHDQNSTTLGNVLQHEGNDVTLIHGHDDDKHGLENGVINVNARSSAFFSVAACLV
jgi:hypothetical protein